MNDKEFEETYCSRCGTQRCEGIGTEWFDGCKHKREHNSYNAVIETEQPDNEIVGRR